MLRIKILVSALLALAASQDVIIERQQIFSFQKTGRIVGGWETHITQFPHQVSLQIGTRHICGATIIAPSFILTAAHCVLRHNEPQLYAIRAGSSQWATGGNYVRVRRIIPHAQFNVPTRMNNDIALIWLQKSLIYSVNIQPIAIVNSSDYVPMQAQLFVSGWGSTSPEVVTATPRLRYTNIVQLDHGSCAQSYFDIATVTNTMFCAGSIAYQRDSCIGDSGGPLITKVAGKFKLRGIVSWGLGCANEEYPGVYTDVAAYAGWLIQTLKTLKA